MLSDKKIYILIFTYILIGILCTSFFVQCGNSRDRAITVIQPDRIERADNDTATAIGTIDNASGAVDGAIADIEHGKSIIDDVTKGVATHEIFVAESADRIERIKERNERVIEIIRKAKDRNADIQDSK